MPETVVPNQPTVSLGGRSFAIVPLRLGRLKKLPRQLALVMQAKALPDGALPEEPLLDAYAAIVTASIVAAAADPSAPVASEPVTPESVASAIEGLEYFQGCAELAFAAAAVMKLSFGDDDSGEVSGPPTPEVVAPSTSTGSMP